MNDDPDRIGQPLPSEQTRDGKHGLDDRYAQGVQIGDRNYQINNFYVYSKGTWVGGVISPPLTDASGVVDSPYRGLNAFEEGDARFFFGRDTAAGKSWHICLIISAEQD
jgi:hypothetical protein